ncbi:hypothetical protein ABEG17_04750 [Pedococcus sp. KACC 23699]|uniref:Uncharacterized protein n=1 Tax=Pedococcus sp. KACC 23699 TaxID=3149228 RepID=A0AAU7JX60_9MICO
MPTRSPVPQEVSDALQRVVRRWQQLPLDHALRCAPAVRALLADLAGDDAPLLPDLGPGVLMDQLAVLVFDACAAGGPGVDSLPSRLRGLLAGLS